MKRLAKSSTPAAQGDEVKNPAAFGTTETTVFKDAARCICCQRRNGECVLEKGASHCKQCDAAEECKFQRTFDPRLMDFLAYFRRQGPREVAESLAHFKISLNRPDGQTILKEALESALSKLTADWSPETLISAAVLAQKGSEKNERRLFACPYFKFDPQRYSERNQTELNYRGCSACVLTNIPRLKQHLYRTHSRPEYYCPVCYEVFKGLNDFDVHIQRRLCSAVEPAFTERMTPEQYIQIKKKRTIEDKAEYWKEIYSVLFPDAIIPLSPYVDDGYEAHEVGSWQGESQSALKRSAANAGFQEIWRSSAYPDNSLGVGSWSQLDYHPSSHMMLRDPSNPLRSSTNGKFLGTKSIEQVTNPGGFNIAPGGLLVSLDGAQRESLLPDPSTARRNPSPERMLTLNDSIRSASDKRAALGDVTLFGASRPPHQREPTALPHQHRLNSPNTASDFVVVSSMDFEASFPTGVGRRTGALSTKEREGAARVRKAGACMHCKKFKAKCSAETPCQRCVAKGLVCVRPNESAVSVE